MNDPANLKLLTSREEIRNAPMMNHRRRIGRAVLEHAGAIHDGVDAGEIRQPIRWGCCV
jgi:hypothetical protein